MHRRMGSSEISGEKGKIVPANRIACSKVRKLEMLSEITWVGETGQTSLIGQPLAEREQQLKKPPRAVPRNCPPLSMTLPHHSLSLTLSYTHTSYTHIPPTSTPALPCHVHPFIGTYSNMPFILPQLRQILGVLDQVPTLTPRIL